MATGIAIRIMMVTDTTMMMTLLSPKMENMHDYDQFACHIKSVPCVFICITDMIKHSIEQLKYDYETIIYIFSLSYTSLTGRRSTGDFLNAEG